MDLDARARRGRGAAGLAVRILGPVVKIDPRTLPQAAEHPLPRTEDVRRAAALPRWLGRGDPAVRAQRGDAVHQPDEDARVPRGRTARRLDLDPRRGAARTASRGSRGLPTPPPPSSPPLDAALAEDAGMRRARADAFLARQSWDRTWAGWTRSSTTPRRRAARERRSTPAENAGPRGSAPEAARATHVRLPDRRRGFRRQRAGRAARPRCRQERAARGQAAAHRRQRLRPLRRRRHARAQVRAAHLPHQLARGLRVPVAVHRVAALRAPRAARASTASSCRSRSTSTPSTRCTA